MEVPRLSGGPYKIGFDMDGVLCHTTPRVYQFCQAQGWLLGRTPADQTHHDFEKAYPGEITKDQVWSLFDQPGFYAGILPCESLVPAFHHLRKNGHELHIITARCGPDHVRQETFSWAEECGLDPHGIHFASPSQKVAVAWDLGLDFMIEDHPETALAMANRGIASFLVETPYLGARVRQAAQPPLPLWILTRTALGELLRRPNSPGGLLARAAHLTRKARALG
jgi:uncharacterized HAD superfamily protein